MSSLPYRKNVAAFILNHSGEILNCKRADKFKDWQLPQGGIDPGETPLTAVRRELKEEVGLISGTLIEALPQPITYLWPEELHSRGFIGQEQYFFLFRAPLGWSPNLDSQMSKEFEDASWDGRMEFLKKIEPTFRAASYKKALSEFLRKNASLFAD